MITLRPRASLHHVEGGWFSANWHFSFDTYADPDNTWFGDLRVFNDDRLIPGAIWPMHPHRDIEGITYVAEGMFEHRDSRGNGGILPPGRSSGRRSARACSTPKATTPRPSRCASSRCGSSRPNAGSSRRSSSTASATPSAVAAGCRSSSRPTATERLMPRRTPTPSPFTRTPRSTRRSSGRARRPTANSATGSRATCSSFTGSATVGEAGELDDGGAAKVSGESGLTVRAGESGAELLLVETRAIDR